MTKATIIQNKGNAFYRVRIDYDFTRLEAEVLALTDQILETEAAIFAGINARADIQTELDDQLSALNDALVAGGSEPDLAVLKPLYVEAERIRARLDAQNRELGRLYSLKLSRSARKTQLQQKKSALLANSELDAWCADVMPALAPGLVVPLCLVAGERGGPTITILPRDENIQLLLDLTDYERSRDGQLVPTISMTPAQAFYNYALFPGWQRWMPSYRHGTINSVQLATGTCTVTLDAATSTARPEGKELTVNEAGPTFSGVLAVYMTCNALAFEAGDRVIVAHVPNVLAGDMDRALIGAPSWQAENMRVIGFIEDPRECPGQLPPSPNHVREFESYLLTVTGERAITTALTSEACGGGQYRVTYSSTTDVTTWGGTQAVEVWAISEATIQTVNFSWTGSETYQHTMTEDEAESDYSTASFTRTLTIYGAYPFIGTVVAFQESEDWTSDSFGERSITYSRTERFIHAVCPETGEYVEAVVTYPESTASLPSGTALDDLIHNATGTKVFRYVKSGAPTVESDPVSAPLIQKTVEAVRPIYDNTCVYGDDPEAAFNGTVNSSRSQLNTVAAVEEENYPIGIGGLCATTLQALYDALTAP